MKVCVPILVIVLTASLGIAQTAKTLTGTVSDNMCGAKHMSKDKPAAECTRECIKMGSDYALVVGNSVYTLKGDKTPIDKFAAEGNSHRQAEWHDD
jgi:hypothetical protein